MPEPAPSGRYAQSYGHNNCANAKSLRGESGRQRRARPSRLSGPMLPCFGPQFGGSSPHVSRHRQIIAEQCKLIEPIETRWRQLPGPNEAGQFPANLIVCNFRNKNCAAGRDFLR